MRYVLSLCSTICLLCSMTFAEESRPTYTKDIAPILYTHCATCHRPGQIGPFALLSYEDARKRAKQLARVTAKRIMPPWKPVSGFGAFQGARVLMPEQIAVFARWVEAGMPQGDPKDLPPLPQFRDGWQLGTPDLILKMPKPFTIPAEGPDIYLHIPFALNLDRDVYLRGVEVLPSNPRVAHHAVGLLDPWGTGRKLARQSQDYQGFGYVNLGGPGFIPSGFTPGYVPGATPRFFPDDQAIRLPKGTDFVLQMHYHPSGTEETDQTIVGLYFTDKKPKRNLGAVGLLCEAIDIPPGAKAHRVNDEFRLPVDYEVRSVWAHMHLIGKSVHVWAELPSGQRRELLKIDDWDFRWQDTYVYAQPFVLPKGTVLKAEWTYDNSADNPRNPNRPPKRVTHGEKSTDEMAGVILGGLPVHPEEEWLVWAAVIGHYFEVHSQATPKRPLIREGAFNSDGVRIHYAVQGKGPAVVLIHAWLADSTMWGKNRWGDNGIVAALAERFQVVTLDCRGHGQSDKPHDIKAYGSKMAEDVVRLLDHLKIDKAHLVGYSMGAILAGKVVAMCPQRVRSVIFAGGAPVLEWDPTDVKRGEAFLNQWEKDRGLQALTHFLVGPQDRAALAAAHRSLRTIRVSAEELKRYTGPLLFIYGREEWPSTKRYVAAARQVWGRGEVIVIGNADHLSTPSRPEFRQAILTFLKAQAP